MPPNYPVSHISDTARWVATYRAMETERPDAIFHDPFARKLAGAHGEEIVNTMHQGRQTAWPMIVRTAVMDELIQQAVDRDGVDTVLNLAAGLDARAYRMTLPAGTRWFDVDLPDILTYKEEQLAGDTPRCAYESVKLDLTDLDARRALFQRVGDGARTTLVITEGLLVYLEHDQVAQLAADLATHPAFRFWLIDLAAPQLLKRLERTWGKQLRDGNAPFKFAPAESTGFFEPHGWIEHEFRSVFEEALRLKRTMPFANFWRLIGRLFPKKKQEEFRRMSGIVMLARRADTRAH